MISHHLSASSAHSNWSISDRGNESNASQLCRGRSLQPESFLDRLVKATEGSYAADAIQGLQHQELIDLIKYHGQLREIVKAVRLFETSLMLNVNLTPYTFHTIMDQCTKNGEDIRAIEFFKKMEELNIQPNHLHYQALTAAHYNLGNKEEAQRIFCQNIGQIKLEILNHKEPRLDCHDLSTGEALTQLSIFRTMYPSGSFSMIVGLGWHSKNGFQMREVMTQELESLGYDVSVCSHNDGILIANPSQQRPLGKLDTINGEKREIIVGDISPKPVSENIDKNSEKENIGLVNNQKKGRKRKKKHEPKAASSTLDWKVIGQQRGEVSIVNKENEAFSLAKGLEEQEANNHAHNAEEKVLPLEQVGHPTVDREQAGSHQADSDQGNSRAQVRKPKKSSKRRKQETLEELMRPVDPEHEAKRVQLTKQREIELKNAKQARKRLMRQKITQLQERKSHAQFCKQVTSLGVPGAKVLQQSCERLEGLETLYEYLRLRNALVEENESFLHDQGRQSIEEEITSIFERLSPKREKVDLERKSNETFTENQFFQTCAGFSHDLIKAVDDLKESTSRFFTVLGDKKDGQLSESILKAKRPNYVVKLSDSLDMSVDNECRRYDELPAFSFNICFRSFARLYRVFMLPMQDYL